MFRKLGFKKQSRLSRLKAYSCLFVPRPESYGIINTEREKRRWREVKLKQTIKEDIMDTVNWLNWLAGC